MSAEEDLIDVALTLLEKSKIYDKNIADAIEALEREKEALKEFRIETQNIAITGVKMAIKSQNDAIKDQVNYIGQMTQRFENAKNNYEFITISLNYILCGLILVAGFFALWRWIPSLDEISARRSTLSELEKQIEESKDYQRLDFAKCDKKLCVQVEKNKCNYGKNGENYCVAKLKKKL